MADYKSIINAYKDLPGGLIESYHALHKDMLPVTSEGVVSQGVVTCYPYW